MIYVYTATFTPRPEGGYKVRVPDLPGCVTTGKDLSDSIEQITDAMSAWLVAAEDEGFDIAPATPQAGIEAPGAVLSIIKADTLKYRTRTDTHAQRKNVSLPAWMLRMADQRGINCSQVLQEALLQRFQHA